MAGILKHIWAKFLRSSLVDRTRQRPERDEGDQLRNELACRENNQSASHRVPRCRSLDGFTELSSSTEGVAVQTLEPFDTIYVHTANGDYSLFLLDPEERRVSVEDGRLFAEPVEMSLSGSTFGGSMLKMGWIGVGLQMEFYAHGNRITTPVVLSVRVDRELTVPFAA